MTEKLIEELDLANGLTISFYDCSRKIAGDRWYVKLVARIPISVDENAFVKAGAEPDLFKEFLDATEGMVTFELQKERNFIDEQEKDQVFNEILSNIKEHALNYLSHKEFAPKFLKKEIQSFLERRKWYQNNP